MGSFFYSKLAAGNIRKNKKAYLPYMLTCTISIMFFYIMLSLSHDPGIKQIVGGETLQMLLYLGCTVVGIFCVIFFFYTNSFLIKNRKKEIALYNILGMAKRNLTKMLFLETIFTSVITLVAGLAGGVILGRLVFLAVLKVLRTEIPVDYSFSPFAAMVTLALFGGIFALVLLTNIGRVQLVSPIQLLSGGRQGEKEPKTKLILTGIGILTTGIGYYIAVTVASPIEALFYFFAAVILVIIGTYCLFTAGSIAVLKILRANKQYYYQTSHFTAVSGMIYRMKRNAAGLASICILSTMVLVTIATTVSMQVGTADVIKKSFSDDIQMWSEKQLNRQEAEALSGTIAQTLQESNAQATSTARYNFFQTITYTEDDRFTVAVDVDNNGKMMQNYYIPLEGSTMAQKIAPLEDDEILISGVEPVELKKLKIGDQTFRVKNGDAGFVYAPMTSMADNYFILVSNQTVLDKIEKHYANTAGASGGSYAGIDLKEPSQGSAVGKAMGKHVGGYTVDVKEDASKDIYAMYGGLLFIGVFLGLLFLIAAVLIIYYKQISEGYEDGEHYKIMQKVGMSQREVKQAIKSQVLMVFFLPLAVAIVHVAASFNMMSKLLGALQLQNIWLFVICTGITILVFVIVYLLVYGVTAREYYNLTKFER